MTTTKTTDQSAEPRIPTSDGKANVGEYLDSNGFIVEVIRTTRKKTADIRVEDGAVSVVVPKGTDADRIQQLIKKKRSWINDKLITQRDTQPVSSKQFISGEAFPYLGRNYRLKVIQGHFEPVKLAHGRLIVTVPDTTQTHMIRNALVRWYKKHAAIKLEEKVCRYREMINVTVKAVGVKTFKSRWGSCSAKGDIHFNWKIIMAPNRMVDYVVAHELCHLKHHDHSDQFWKAVEKVIPDNSACRAWLKENSRQLDY